MGKPSGRRRKPLQTFFSEAEVELLEAVRAANPLPRSRADFLLDLVEPEAERLADHDDRVRQALDALAQEERQAVGFRERGGRPPRPRVAMDWRD